MELPSSPGLTSVLGPNAFGTSAYVELAPSLFSQPHDMCFTFSTAFSSVHSLIRPRRSSRCSHGVVSSSTLDGPISSTSPDVSFLTHPGVPRSGLSLQRVCTVASLISSLWPYLSFPFIAQPRGSMPPPPVKSRLVFLLLWLHLIHSRNGRLLTPTRGSGHNPLCGPISSMACISFNTLSLVRTPVITRTDYPAFHFLWRYTPICKLWKRPHSLYPPFQIRPKRNS